MANKPNTPNSSSQLPAVDFSHGTGLASALESSLGLGIKPSATRLFGTSGDLAFFGQGFISFGFPPWTFWWNQYEYQGFGSSDRLHLSCFSRAISRMISSCQVLKRPSPPFGDVSKLKAKDGALCAKIVGPGGGDQVQAFNDCWAVCGYNLMKAWQICPKAAPNCHCLNCLGQEFGGQSLRSPPSSLRPDLVVIRNKAFSINYADICIRWGLYESALRYVGWPIIPGFDLAGANPLETLKLVFNQ